MLSEVPHGTRAGYRAGCRCLTCRAAHATYKRLCLSRPRRPTVDASDARRYLQRLREQGIGYRQVARLTGLSSQQVRIIRNGRQQCIRPDTLRRIMACQPAMAGYALVTAWWPRRHISALIAEGFTARQVARAAGVHLPSLQQAQRVRQRTAARIEAIYRDVVEDADFGRRADWLRSLEG